MPESSKPIIELGIEFLVGPLLFLYPFGADQMNLPHDFWLGLGCWIVGTAIAIRMFWIFPVGISRVSPAVRSLISIAFVVLLVVVFYKPIAIAYHKRGASARRSAPASPAPVIQKSPANKTKQAQPAQGATATGNGSTNAAGNINQSQSENSNAAIGNDNFQNTGDITQTVAPCGIAQIGNKNIATVNCAPPSGTELAKFGAGTVVQIESDALSYAVPIATGFWLNNKGYVATCLHSLAGKAGIGAAVPMPPLLGQSLTVASGRITTIVEPIASDTDADIAILRVLNNPFERSLHGVASAQKLDGRGHALGQAEVATEQYWVPTVAGVLAHDGDDIIKVGFIQQNDMPVATYDFGHITRMGVDPSLAQESYRIFTSFSYKDSDCGAPIINNAKTVIGMMHGPSGEGIPSTYILKLLGKVH